MIGIEIIDMALEIMVLIMISVLNDDYNSFSEAIEIERNFGGETQTFTVVNQKDSMITSFVFYWIVGVLSIAVDIYDISKRGGDLKVRE
jgi:hypothetical protein